MKAHIVIVPYDKSCWTNNNKSFTIIWQSSKIQKHYNRKTSEFYAIKKHTIAEVNINSFYVIGENHSVKVFEVNGESKFKNFIENIVKWDDEEMLEEIPVEIIKVINLLNGEAIIV